MNDYEQFQKFLKDKDTDLISNLMFGMTVKQFCEKNHQCDFSLTMTDHEYEAFKKLSEWLTVMRHDNLNFQERKYKLTEMFIEYLAEDFYKEHIRELSRRNENLKEILEDIS